LHLVAPHEDRVYQPARAVADGKVIYLRRPTEHTSAPEHGLNYSPNGEVQWTDDGCVILEHSTELGALDGIAVSFTWYSLTMHLSTIDPGVKLHQRLWRKDPLGKAGSIYGAGAQIHFEVCCDTTQLKRLIGREPAWIELDREPAPTQDGRKDCVWGDMLIYLPASTPTEVVKPTATERQPFGTQTPLHAAQWVRMHYDKGDCTLTSLDLLGKPIGNPIVEKDFEYDLYKTACARHAKSPQQPGLSSPSGWYELLRFGRNLGPDPLPPKAAHWRQIDTPNGKIWADLNGQGTYKFSEADFPAVLGWKVINDDRDPLDQRVQSHQMSRLLQDPTPNSPEREKPGHKNERLGSDEVQAKLKHTICYFPTEWDRETVGKRHQCQADPREPGGTKPSEKVWNAFVAHCDALTADDLPQEYKNAMWRFHPRTFIETMKKCSWLSRVELLQFVPEQVVRGKGAGLSGPFLYERTEPTAGSLIANSNVELNTAMRKHGICTPKRIAAFVGNSIQETGWWANFNEAGGPNKHYAPWYGRGFLQLTNPDGKFSSPSNYEKYFLFRGFAFEGESTSQLLLRASELSKNSHDASASAGAYWSWMRTNAIADVDGVNVRKMILLDVESQLSKGRYIVIYENSVFRKVACAINLPGAMNDSNPKLNGLVSRYCAYALAQAVVMDTAMFPQDDNTNSLYPHPYATKKTK